MLRNIADINEFLNKIMAEIDAARYIDKDTKLCKNANASGLEVAMHIIDKYRDQEPKTGHWIRVPDKTGHFVWKCDKCGWQQRFNTKYCPDCGAKMEV